MQLPVLSGGVSRGRGAEKLKAHYVQSGKLPIERSSHKWGPRGTKKLNAGCVSCPNEPIRIAYRVEVRSTKSQKRTTSSPPRKILGSRSRSRLPTPGVPSSPSLPPALPLFPSVLILAILVRSQPHPDTTHTPGTVSSTPALAPHSHTHNRLTVRSPFAHLRQVTSILHKALPHPTPLPDFQLSSSSNPRPTFFFPPSLPPPAHLHPLIHHLILALANCCIPVALDVTSLPRTFLHAGIRGSIRFLPLSTTRNELPPNNHNHQLLPPTTRASNKQTDSGCAPLIVITFTTTNPHTKPSPWPGILSRLGK